MGLVLAVIVYALTAGHRRTKHSEPIPSLSTSHRPTSEGQYDQALQNFKSLDANSQATYQVLYMSAFCESQTGDYAAAASHMQMAQEARPALVRIQSSCKIRGDSI